MVARGRSALAYDSYSRSEPKGPSVVMLEHSRPSPLVAALGYGAAGFRVFPLKPFSKEPAISAWPSEASADEALIRQWWREETSRGVGLACGPQPNGLSVLGFDIDSYKGGEESWRALVLADELDIARIMTSPVARTPRNGWHIFFSYEGVLRNSRSKLGEGLDTRGEGGFMALAPSRVADPVSGAIGEYGWWGGQDLAGTPLVPLPEPLLVRLLAQPAPSSPAPRLRLEAGGGVSVADRLRAVWDWDSELLGDGWRFVKQTGGDRYYARPGKTDRGHSAVVHPSGAFVVFSTEAPPTLERLGRPTKDGTGFSVSPFHYVAGMRFGGDMSAAGRWLHAVFAEPDLSSLPVAAPPGPTRQASDPGDVAAPVGAVVNGSPLDEAFWGASPHLAHIRQAAQARLCSPDALLVNALARSATMVHPSWRLPAVVGSQATLDFMGCVVAETAGGKSIANDVARDLLPDPGALLPFEDRQLMFDLSPGSGEGVVQAFMVPERKEDPESGKLKATGRQVVGRQALHLVVDESVAFISQASRQGTTIVPTLASAWSGKGLGQLNASAETRRVIDGGRVRVAAVFNMQTSNAHLLFTEAMLSIGFVGRVLFASAHDPAAPDSLPEWPGPLPFKPSTGVEHGTREFTYHPDIVAEIIAERRSVLTGTAQIDKASSHATLLRCKIAAILSMWDSTSEVNLDTWALAGSIVSSSQFTVKALYEHRQRHLATQRHHSAEEQAEREYTVDSLRERRAIADLSTKIVARAAEKSMTRRDLGRALSSSKTRHRFEAAFELAVSNGYIREVEGRVEHLSGERGTVPR